MGSRIRENPKHVFECFFEVVIPKSCNEAAWILQQFPENYNDEEVLKSVPQFAYPCESAGAGVQHFSFVLTSIDSTWTFGYCRHAPDSPTCFVILSYLPWHETFYKLLNHVAELANGKESGDLTKFLESLYSTSVPEPGLQLCVTYKDFKEEFSASCPDHHKLPSIPENRNLTEYFNAIDAHNMMIIFASMLHERRILIVSKRLSRLSACVQAANSLIYPMNWQHIFIPVLPTHLLDYLNAPMPFLIGVPASTMLRVKRSELGEVVLLDADNNKVESPFEDLSTLPTEIVTSLKHGLKDHHSMLGDGVARAFLKALVRLIGGYRDALKLNLGEKITFSPEAFVQSRPPSMQPFLEKMLHLQIFQQFIEERLEILNSGKGFSDEFEFEVNMHEYKTSSKFRTQYKEWMTAMRKEGGAFLKTVRSKTNPAMKHAYKSVKDKGRKAYKDIRSKIQEIHTTPKSPQSESSGPADISQPRSAPSSPTRSSPRKFSTRKAKSYVTEDIMSSSFLKNNEVIIKELTSKQYNLLNADEEGQEALEDLILDSDHSPNLSMQRINMDLMGDLQDIIFQHCTFSGEESDRPKPVVDRSLKPDRNMTDAASTLVPSSSVDCITIPAPMPPPRHRRRNTGPSEHSSLQNTLVNSHHRQDHEAPLIHLDSPLDEIVFDPLLSNEYQSTANSNSKCHGPISESKQPQNCKISASLSSEIQSSFPDFSSLSTLMRSDNTLLSKSVEQIPPAAAQTFPTTQTTSPANNPFLSYPTGKTAFSSLPAGSERHMFFPSAAQPSSALMSSSCNAQQTTAQKDNDLLAEYGLGFGLSGTASLQPSGSPSKQFSSMSTAPSTSQNESFTKLMDSWKQRDLGGVKPQQTWQKFE